jgi:multiple sugar transport system ATP-binding protein
VVAVDDLSLTLEPGQTLALLGPSGCGKSTTLAMIVGLETPSSGEILIDGVSVLDVPPGRRNVGLVFQDYAVFGHMTVAGNLAFGLAVRGIDRRTIRKRVRETAELLGLEHLLTAPASRLGGSELQRVAIGRTLVTRPALLLLDEPLSNLEAEMRQTMRRELRRLQAETGLTIVYVTHDQIEALSLAQRIAVMNEGRLRQCDRTEIVYEQPAHVFVAGFLGDPPMNLVPGTIAAEAACPTFRSGGLHVRLAPSVPPHLAGRPVVLGVRPDAIRFAPPAAGVPGLVRSIELRGGEAVAAVDVEGCMLAVVAAAHGRPTEGERVWLDFDRERIALFAPDTGRNLGAAQPWA